MSVHRFGCEHPASKLERRRVRFAPHRAAKEEVDAFGVKAAFVVWLLQCQSANAFACVEVQAAGWTLLSHGHLLLSETLTPLDSDWKLQVADLRSAEITGIYLSFHCVTLFILLSASKLALRKMKI